VNAFRTVLRRDCLVLAGLLAAAVVLVPPGKAASAGYQQTNLVSDVPGAAARTDPNLVNPWGLAFNAARTVLWASDNGTGRSTLYNSAGVPNALVVTIPPPPGSPGPSTPTGMVFNGTPNTLKVTKAGKTAGSAFLWATEDGTIAGWSPTVDATNAVLAVDHSAQGAVYKGLAIVPGAAGPFLYATNFRAGTVEVYDSQFNPVPLAKKAFFDQNIPRDYAPFGIQNIGGNLFVTYAKQVHPEDLEDKAGHHRGFVDVFDPTGKLLRRFATRDTLDSPWAVALAPANFGQFSNALLVGNFGDGRINAYDFATGDFLGQLQDASGSPIEIDGLWGLAFGPGATATAPARLWFAAGPDDEAHGLLGPLEPAP